MRRDPDAWSVLYGDVEFGKWAATSPPASYLSPVRMWLDSLSILGPPTEAREAGSDGLFVAKVPPTRVIATYLVIEDERERVIIMKNLATG